MMVTDGSGGAIPAARSMHGYSFQQIFNPTGVADLEEQCRKAGSAVCSAERPAAPGGGHDPVYEKRQELMQNPGFVDEVLAPAIKKPVRQPKRWRSSGTRCILEEERQMQEGRLHRKTAGF